MSGSIEVVAGSSKVVAIDLPSAGRGATSRELEVVAIEVVRDARRRVRLGSCPCAADSVAVVLGAARSRLAEVEMDPSTRTRLEALVESLLADC